MPTPDPQHEPKSAQQEGHAEAHEPRMGTGFWGVVKSVFWAGFGVQSDANRERDFKHGKMLHFIVGGILGTAVFLFLIWMWVQAMLSGS